MTTAELKAQQAAEQAEKMRLAAQAPALVREIVSARVLLAQRRCQYIPTDKATAQG